MDSVPQVAVLLNPNLAPGSCSLSQLLTWWLVGALVSGAVHLRTSGAAGSWQTCHELLPGLLKPVTPSHILLSSQICLQSVAGVVISHATEKWKVDRSLYALALGQETFKWWSSWSNRSYLSHRMASPCKSQISMGRGVLLDIVLWKFVFLGWWSTSLRCTDSMAWGKLKESKCLCAFELTTD